MSSVPSALRPVANSEELPVPERPESWNLEDDAEMDLGEREMDRNTEYVLPN
jgi:hypothetical protein